MKFKRLLMPVSILGIILTMGSMVYAQSTITCGLADAATTDNIGPFASINGGTAIVMTNIGTEGGNTLQGPSANAANTGHTEVIAAGATRIPATPGGSTIRVWCVNPGPTPVPAGSAGVVVLTLTFGSPITNTQTFPSSTTGIRVTNGTGDFIAAGTGVPPAGANVGISSVSNSGGTIVIGIGTPVATSTGNPPQNPAVGANFTTGVVSTFDLQGVLLGTNGKSGEIDVTVTETSGNVNLSSSTVPVISSVTQGIQDPTVPTTLPSLVGSATITGGPAQLNSAGLAIKGNFTVKVAENFPSMWQTSTQYNGGAVFPASPSSSTQVNFIFKNVPPGLNISNCSTVLTDPTGTVVNPGTTGTAVASANAITAASNIITVNFTGGMIDPNNSDVLWLTCSNVSLGGAALPLPSTAVTVQAELGPLGTALAAGSNAALTGLATGLIPRYQDTPQPAAGGVPVILFPPSQTTLLVPYAVVIPGSFNTGIAIANTTSDVFAGNGGATPAAGTITFTLFSNAGGSTTFTSPSVASGTTYAQNVSSMLASGTTTFAGYIFVQANFSQAHGGATIYTTSTGAAALSSPVLVVTSGTNNVTLANGRLSPESLGQ